MKNRLLKWTVFVFLGSLLLLFLCAACIFAVDPFEHYRESSILPLYDNESYNNPGIAKNYDYDAVILGTSMVEMSRPSVIDSCFGVHSVKLPMRGSYSAQMGWQLNHIYRTHDLKLAILAVDAYSLMGDPDDKDELYDYLWNDNPLDDVNYLLNLDVLLTEVPKTLANAGKSLEGKRDAMFQWTDVVFSEESVLAVTPAMQQKEMQDADYRLERSTENIQRHIEKYVSEHPETQFRIYMPPYSVGYWYRVTREGISEQQYRSRRRVCELLLKYPNVEIYDFSSCISWIEDLDEYFDYSHHSSAVSDRIMAAMAAGEHRVTNVEEMEAGSAEIRKAVERFAEKIE